MNDHAISGPHFGSLNPFVFGEAGGDDYMLVVDWVEGWGIGKPDAVYQLPLPFDVPASGVIGEAAIHSRSAPKLNVNSESIRRKRRAHKVVLTVGCDQVSGGGNSP